VKSSPIESGTGLFVIHAGTKVKITDELGDWLRIRIADGNEGWILSSDLERI
jgi:SH3-like domain-containing protein